LYETLKMRTVGGIALKRPTTWVFRKSAGSDGRLDFRSFPT
jgi:hypothetical protein